VEEEECRDCDVGEGLKAGPPFTTLSSMRSLGGPRDRSWDHHACNMRACVAQQARCRCRVLVVDKESEGP
jgi:hypothetical protein